MRCRCIFFLLFIIILGPSMGSAIADEERTDTQQVSSEEQYKPLEPSSLWIVVNLFTGKTSKQAVIVRDKLMKLGVGGTGIVLPFGQVTTDNIIKLRPAFLALSPNGMPWCRYRGRNREDLENFFSALRIIVDQMNVPVVGICGGHQALALAFGGKVGPIRGGEDDCFPYGKHPTERGRHNLQVIGKDPIFDGMPETINLVENHFDEIKKLPPGFIHLAKNALSPFQIIKHPTKPVYGVQAHTEYFYSSRPDGGTLLRNFLRIVATHNREVRRPAVKQTSDPASEQKSLTQR